MAGDKSAFYDTNLLIAYLLKEEDRFEAAKQALKRHALKAISIITIHEIHMYSVRLGVEERFAKSKEMLHKLFKITLP